MAKKSARTKTTPASNGRRWLMGGGAFIAIAAAIFVTVLSQGGGDALTTVRVSDLANAAVSGATVIDVREPYEYEAGHVEGALLMPLANTVRLASDLPKDEPVYVVCRSGNRSLVAAQELVEAGFEDVRNVDGGMIAWQSAGLPVTR